MKRPTPDQVRDQLAALDQLAGHTAEGIEPYRLKPGDVVCVAGMGGTRFAVLDAPADGLIHLTSETGTRLRAGWKALRWPAEVAS